MNYYLTVQCGSRLYNLENDISDWDYFALVGGEGSEALSNDMQTLVKKDNKDFFLHRLDSMLSIVYCASPFIAPYTNAVTDYESQSLKEYWDSNCYALADIAAGITYKSAIEQVEKYVELNYEKGFKICARLMGVQWSRYYVGNMLAARNLPEKWRSRYFAAKNGEAGIEDVKGWLDEIRTPSIQRYFSLEPINYELHNEYCQLINSILEESNNE